MNMMYKTCSTILMVTLFLIITGVLHFSAETAAAKPTIKEILSMTPFKPGDAEIARKGGTISTGLNVVSNREIGVGVACLIKDNQANPLAQFGKNKSLLSDDIVSAIGIIPENANLKAFTKFSMGKDTLAEAEQYRQFESGFGLNLSTREIAMFRSISDPKDSGVSEFEKMLRKQIYDRYTNYRKNGFKGIPRYKRDGNDFTDPANELRQTLKKATALEKIFPKYYSAWWKFPESMPSGADESYRWYILNLDERPAVILAHRIEDGYEGSIDGQIIGERFFYASRFLNIGYAMVALIPVEEGNLFFFGYRVWIDQWSGFASVKHSIGQELMIKRMIEHLERLKICR
jgi:hypothetical protein